MGIFIAVFFWSRPWVSITFNRNIFKFTEAFATSWGMDGRSEKIIELPADWHVLLLSE